MTTRVRIRCNRMIERRWLLKHHFIFFETVHFDIERLCVSLCLPYASLGALPCRYYAAVFFSLYVFVRIITFCPKPSSLAFVVLVRIRCHQFAYLENMPRVGRYCCCYCRRCQPAARAYRSIKLYTQFSMFDVSLAMNSATAMAICIWREYVMHVLCKLNFDKND